MATQQKTPTFGKALTQNGSARSVYDELRRPFTASAVKFKPQTVKRDMSAAMATFHIDARLVEERLNSVVGPEAWSDSYKLLAEAHRAPELFYPVECQLTINGVTKTDVGQAQNLVDDKAWKAAYSDALKRAAVKFGVGAYLYALPKLWAPVDTYTTKKGDKKASGFSKEGAQHLRRQYQAWLASDLNRWGEPLDHGDLDDPEEGGVLEPPATEAGGGAADMTEPAPPPPADKAPLLLAEANWHALPREKKIALAHAWQDANELPRSDSIKRGVFFPWLISAYPARLDDLASLADDLEIGF